MFNLKKIKEAVKKMTSVILTASLSLGIFSAVPIKAMERRDIFIIGNEKSGKTVLFRSIFKNEFNEVYKPTIVADFMFKEELLSRIWDTSGQKKYYNFFKTYIKGSDAIILAVAYDDKNWQGSMKTLLGYIDENVSKLTPLKVVITKSDINEKERKFTKENVEEYLKNNTGTYQKLKIENTVIETSAKNNNGINHKENEERNPKTCLEDYLLDLLEIPEQTQDNPKQIQYNQKQQEHKSTLKKAVGVMTKHPVISCTIGTLVTGIVVTPLVIFRNKIIKGIESIFGKKQIKKPTAKRIKITN